MSRRARLSLFALAGPGLAAVLVLGFRGLPAFGDYHGVYGAVVNGVELTERHATDMVTALNFDLRAFDTLGEEYILFAAVLAVTLLLRELRDEDEPQPPDGDGAHRFAGPSDALRAMSLVLIALLVAFGVYLVVHGALTPGGGFQGGIVLAAGPVALLVAGRYLALKSFAPDWALDALEAIGAGAYAMLGLGGLVFASVYFKNFLPLGIPGHLLSAGFMPLNSVAVGLEVTGGFLLVWTEFLDQALLVRRGGR
ncbi:MAG: Na(+) antiporter subunit [Solirubrobacterales bacterium]|nr:Na(+) antiporter subunit [Solirubrobacterales bacterium]